MNFLSNVAFGDVDSADLNTAIDDINRRMRQDEGYKFCVPSMLVSEYAQSDLSKTKPTLDFNLDEVKEYEKCGDAKTRELAKLVVQFSDDDAAMNLSKIESIDGLIRDINDFKVYLQIKMQTTKGLTTPLYNDWYNEQYWGDTTSYLRASRMAGEESMKRANKKQALAQLVKSQASYQLSTQYQDFYLELSSKYGPKFSQAEQKKLKEFFVDTTVYEWAVADFLSTGKLLERVLSHEDITKYYMFIPMAVTGYFFEDAEKSPTKYMERVKSFANAGKQALQDFLGPFQGASTVSIETASDIAQRCNNDATCIANYFRDATSGAPLPVGGTLKIPNVVYVVATGFLLWKFLKK